MDGHEQRTSEPLFRANKRRKVLRRRTDTDYDGGQDAPEVTTIAEVTGTTAESADAKGETGALPAMRPRAITRKYGIAFTSNKAAASAPAHNEETAMIAVHPSREQNLAQIDRFVKPTGRIAAPEDDKHMMAYVDSKLADVRSTTLMPSNGTFNRATNELPDSAGPKEHTATERARTETDTAEARASGHVSRPNTRRATNQKPRIVHRDPKEAVRDSLVDQILREAAVPLYDRSASGTPFNAEEGIDNDEAVAEAFKAEFLADLEEQNRRKPPQAPPPGKGEVQTSNGPKLGGSRAQRARHQAAKKAREEAAQLAGQVIRPIKVKK